MTNEELYQVMKDGFEQIRIEVKTNFDYINERFNQVDQRFNQIDGRLDRMDDRLNEMDTRLRGVETGVSELKGKRSAIGEVRGWIVTSCAVGAIIISIVVAIFK